MGWQAALAVALGCGCRPRIAGSSTWSGVLLQSVRERLEMEKERREKVLVTVCSPYERWQRPPSFTIPDGIVRTMTAHGTSTRCSWDTYTESTKDVQEVERSSTNTRTHQRHCSAYQRYDAMPTSSSDQEKRSTSQSQSLTSIVPDAQQAKTKPSFLACQPKPRRRQRPRGCGSEAYTASPGIRYSAPEVCRVGGRRQKHARQ